MTPAIRTTFAALLLPLAVCCTGCTASIRAVIPLPGHHALKVIFHIAEHSPEPALSRP